MDSNQECFSVDEINKFREYAKQEKNHKEDLLFSDLLYKVLTDKRIIDIFKDCLGDNQVYYFGDSSISINSKGNGFHKDSRDRGSKNSHEFKDKNYSLLRLGIYLQDHSRHSKDLCLRSNSHRHLNVRKGKIANVKGNVVVWKLTTTHSANADILLLFPNYAFHPRIARRFPDILKQKSVAPRIALFMSFGLADSYAKSFVEYLKTRKYAIDRWKKINVRFILISISMRLNRKTLV